MCTHPGRPTASRRVGGAEVPAHVSAMEDLALHGPRVLGFASAARVAARYRLDPGTVHELLLDHEARGWVQHTGFGGLSGWSVTDAGRVEDERRLALELDLVGARDAVAAIHHEFLPLNQRFGETCTQWQLRPTRLDPLAANDHTDWAWDERVRRRLTSLGAAVGQLCTRLADLLHRFDGYGERYAAALAHVDAGRPRWVDAPEVDSCHTVWVQLHEDLLATLGTPRGQDAEGPPPTPPA